MIVLACFRSSAWRQRPESRDTPDLKHVLPDIYSGIEKRGLIELAKLLGPVDIEGDAFGRVKEHFVGDFAAHQVQKGGKVYTPA